ncbi:MAG: dephospho-CoA kinase [Porphyromonadaceae bacterium CG2_30_38_12]|nr:MAG: dephospho-CoA kinase [Porphyromonadaceae bacterium CG2_30_38_12]
MATIIGITGGIGGGKSTLSTVLSNAGYAIYNTDKEARRLQNEDQNIRLQIVEKFGKEAYTNNILNRSFIASLVFSNSELLKKMNAIVHPAVQEDFRKWRGLHETEKCIFLECAILIEGNFRHYVDKIVLITASEATRIARVKKRDNLTVEQIKARMKNQRKDVDLIPFADYVINTDITDLKQFDLEKFLGEILSLPLAAKF